MTPAPSVATPEPTPPPAGGSVVVGVLGEPATFDPYAPVASDLTWTLARPVYPSLFRLLPDGRPEPYLATRSAESGETVTVELGNASWSDGRPITAFDVAASARRARPPSGFARFIGIEALDGRTVELRGAPQDWRQALATAAFVLPEGRPRAPAGISGGPLRMVSVTPGLEVVYLRNPNWVGGPTALDRVTVRFVAGLDIMLALFERGDLDVIVPPGSVNLDDRLDAMGAEASEALGWEHVDIRFNRARTTEGERAGFAALLDRDLLVDGLVRDDGRSSQALHPRPGASGATGPWNQVPVDGGTPPDPVVLSAPVGDELLGLMQRAIFEQLNRAGIGLELVNVEPSLFYGRWSRHNPAHASLVRSAGAPGLGGGRRVFRAMGALPIAQVETLIAWSAPLRGPAANPTFEGPLWNVGSWFFAD